MDRLGFRITGILTDYPQIKTSRALLHVTHKALAIGQGLIPVLMRWANLSAIYFNHKLTDESLHDATPTSFACSILSEVSVSQNVTRIQILDRKSQPCINECMRRSNQLLVTDEPVEFEK